MIEKDHFEDFCSNEFHSLINVLLCSFSEIYFEPLDQKILLQLADWTKRNVIVGAPLSKAPYWAAAIVAAFCKLNEFSEKSSGKLISQRAIGGFFKVSRKSFVCRCKKILFEIKNANCRSRFCRRDIFSALTMIELPDGNTIPSFNFNNFEDILGSVVERMDDDRFTEIVELLGSNRWDQESDAFSKFMNLIIDQYDFWELTEELDFSDEDIDHGIKFN